MRVFKRKAVDLSSCQRVRKSLSARVSVLLVTSLISFCQKPRELSAPQNLAYEALHDLAEGKRPAMAPPWSLKALSEESESAQQLSEVLTLASRLFSMEAGQVLLIESGEGPNREKTIKRIQKVATQEVGEITRHYTELKPKLSQAHQVLGHEELQLEAKYVSVCTSPTGEVSLQVCPDPSQKGCAAHFAACTEMGGKAYLIYDPRRANPSSETGIEEPLSTLLQRLPYRVGEAAVVRLERSADKRIQVKEITLSQVPLPSAGGKLFLKTSTSLTPYLDLHACLEKAEALAGAAEVWYRP